LRRIINPKKRARRICGVAIKHHTAGRWLKTNKFAARAASGVRQWGLSFTDSPFFVIAMAQFPPQSISAHHLASACSEAEADWPAELSEGLSLSGEWKPKVSHETAAKVEALFAAKGGKQAKKKPHESGPRAASANDVVRLESHVRNGAWEAALTLLKERSWTPDPAQALMDWRVLRNSFASGVAAKSAGHELFFDEFAKQPRWMKAIRKTLIRMNEVSIESLAVLRIELAALGSLEQEDCRWIVVNSLRRAFSNWHCVPSILGLADAGAFLWIDEKERDALIRRWSEPPQDIGNVEPCEWPALFLLGERGLVALREGDCVRPAQAAGMIASVLRDSEARIALEFRQADGLMSAAIAADVFFSSAKDPASEWADWAAWLPTARARGKAEPEGLRGLCWERVLAAGERWEMQRAMASDSDAAVGVDPDTARGHARSAQKEAIGQGGDQGVGVRAQTKRL